MPNLFRYSLRDLLWLTLVVAVALAWYADRANDKLRETYRRMACEELTDVVMRSGGWKNVHSIEFSYSRWYGTEWKILPVDSNKSLHFRTTFKGDLEDYDDPTLSWPRSTMMSNQSLPSPPPKKPRYLKSDYPGAHVYVPGPVDRASCAVCGLRAYDGVHLVRELEDSDYPIIPAGD